MKWILRERFLYESALNSFSLVTFGKKALLYEKCAQKMLMKLTPVKQQQLSSGFFQIFAIQFNSQNDI